MLENYFILILPVYTLISLLFPELNLVLFLFIGRIAYEPRMGFFGLYSLNHINLLILLIHIVWTVKTHSSKLDIKIPDMDVFILFLSWLCINFIFLTKNIEYGFDKILVTVFVTFLCVIFTYIRYQYLGNKSIFRILLFLCVIGFCMGSVGLIEMISGAVKGRIAIFGGGPNVFGRITGLSNLILIIFFRRFKEYIPKSLLIGAIIILLIGLISTLSKGPTLSFFITLCFLFFFGGIKRSKIQNIFYILSTLGILIAMIFLLGKAERFFLDPFSAMSYGSYGTRVGQALSSYSAFVDSPIFGVGLGDFIFYNHTYDYPHNILLEILAELGILGLILFFIILYYFFQSITKYINNRYSKNLDVQILRAGLATTLFMFFNQLVSGDLMDARIFFFLLFITLLISNNLNQSLILTQQNA